MKRRIIYFILKVNCYSQNRTKVLLQIVLVALFQQLVTAIEKKADNFLNLSN